MKIRKLKRPARLLEGEDDALEMIRAYSGAYCRVLRDPSDKDAERIMHRCEDYIVMDEDVVTLVGDPLEFLYRLDKQLEDAHERRLGRCRR